MTVLPDSRWATAQDYQCQRGFSESAEGLGHDHWEHHEGEPIESEQKQAGGAGVPGHDPRPQPAEPEQRTDGHGGEQQHDAEQLTAQRGQQGRLLSGVPVTVTPAG
jgi:hypothetical protein